LMSIIADKWAIPKGASKPVYSERFTSDKKFVALGVPAAQRPHGFRKRKVFATRLAGKDASCGILPRK